MLRKAVSILLILAMSMQSLYQLGLVTWFEVNREYVAAVLCVNKKKPEMHCKGQCYLKKQMQKAEEKQPVSGDSSRAKTEFQFFVIEDFSLDLQIKSPPVSGHTPYLAIRAFVTDDDKFRPPSLS
jgi:hypothetical protein